MSNDVESNYILRLKCAIFKRIMAKTDDFTPTAMLIERNGCHHGFETKSFARKLSTGIHKCYIEHSIIALGHNTSHSRPLFTETIPGKRSVN